jgi:FemAB-related protein (PEP-CTERM system-associated)
MPAICSIASMQVRSYEDKFQDPWDDYVHHHPSASVFHLTAWKRAIERVFRFEPRYLLFEDQGRIGGVLPMFLVKNPIVGKALISTPFAVYGGICASDPQAVSVLRGAACQMAKEEGVQYLELREQTARRDPDFVTKHLYVTFDQELPASADRLLQGLPRDTRYMIRKGQKNELGFVQDNGQLSIFYEIYAHSVQHLGTPVFSKRLFQVLLEEFGKACEIAVVWHKAQAIAGVLSFRFRNCILPYYGGSLAEGRPLAANNFMYWEVMKRALESGVRHFDFGRSKLGTGSYAFKTQWNMRERPLPYQFYLVRRQNMPNYSPVNPRFRIAVELWKHLPFRLTKWLGPGLVRLFP